MNDKAENEMRLNRYIARCGASSRREADLMIASGRIMVNGEVCTELWKQIKPRSDTVHLDGEPLELPPLDYYKLYKPPGVVTTMDDPHGRISIKDLIDEYDIPEGVVPAGRLDLDSEGLLILTNDGNLLQTLTHPSHGIEKKYRVLIDRWPMEWDIARLRRGLKFRDYIVKALSVARMGPQPIDDEHPSPGYWLEIILGEGRKREIREMMQTIRYRVQRLIRIEHGPVKVYDLKPGQIKKLGEQEVKALTSIRAESQA